MIAKLKTGNCVDLMSINSSSVPLEVSEVIRACWRFNPLTRPYVSNVIHTLENLLPDPSTSLIDRVTKRLERYNTELEEAVRERNKNLMEEMSRVDDLLSDLLPG